MSSKLNLKLDWCTQEAMKYALRRWYYHDTIPRGKLARIGIWENDQFIGVLVFGNGGNKNLASSIGFHHTEACELVRVAIGQHQVPVSRILGIALRIIAKEYPGLKAVVSYCDPAAGHHGGIYQATNWVYIGKTKPVDYYEDNRGKLHHWRTARHLQKSGVDLKKVYFPGKHKYVFPFNPAVRAELEKKSLPYPSAAEAGDHPDQGQGDGAAPIQPL